MKSSLWTLFLSVSLSSFAFAQSEGSPHKGRMLTAPVRPHLLKTKEESAKKAKNTGGAVSAKTTAYLSVPHINYF